MKKILALLMAAAMLLTLCACASQTSETTNTTEAAETETSAPAPKEVKMTDGYYFLDINGMKCFVHFAEDGTYYALYFGGSVTEAGTWELLDEPMEYMSEDGADDDANTTEDNTYATAPQTVVFTNYATGTPVKVAFVEDALVDMSLGGMANHRTLTHVPDYAYNPSVEEIAIQLFVFYANNDIGSNFILNHNRTFEDVTGDTFEDGTWTLTGPGSYELTYSTGKAALTVAENGKTAVIAKEDGTTIELKDDYKEEAAIAKVMSLTADEVTVEGLPMTVALRLDGYSDGTCQMYVVISQIGAELLADEGTFEVSDAMRPTFHFAAAGDIEGTPDYAGATETGIPFTVAYAADVQPEFNGEKTPMSLNAEVTGIYNPNATAEEVTVAATVRAEDAQVGLPMGVGLRIDCYSDGTAKLIVEIAQINTELEVDKGTYEISEAMKFTFAFEKAGEVIGEPDYATATDTSVDINVAYQADVDAEFNGEMTPMSIDATLTGTYTAG